jgi:hypothetical protein
MGRSRSAGFGRCLFLCIGLGSSAASFGLTINRNFIAAGGSFGSGLGNAASAPTANVAGGGDLVSIFNAAADCWEMTILDNHTVNLTYGWQALSGGTLGVHVLTGQGGAPHRETSGVIRFDRDGSSPMFLDSTPALREEYGALQQSTQNLGGGNMVTGRWFGSAVGAAAGRFDLFSIALHEIGHSLGLSSANTQFQAGNGDLDVDVTAPRPYAGASIPTISGAHLNLSNALMFPAASLSRRILMSHADTVANAEISKFVNLNLDACIVPEPAVMAALGMGIVGMLRRRRNRR